MSSSRLVKALPLLRRRWPRAVLLLAGWTLVGLFFATQLYLIYARLFERPITWGEALATTLPEWYVWGLLAPLIVALAKRVRLEHLSFSAGLKTHLLASVLFALLHLGLLLGFRGLLSWQSEAAFPWLTKLGTVFAANFHWNVLTYWTILGLAQAVEYYARFRAQELRASRLETELAQAQLQVLRTQLQPHFLFNTLNSISALMEEDVRAANRMLARLSDLLRIALETGGTHEVSLQQELAFLDRYLKIEQTRFADRLEVRLDIAPETLPAQVPTLLLQPLVENAIRHGIAARPGHGRIELRAAREDGTLQLHIRDDGPGIHGAASPRGASGVGIANTRARLERLYASTHRFELRNRPAGGLEVWLSIPFREAPCPSAR